MNYIEFVAFPVFRTAHAMTLSTTQVRPLAAFPARAPEVAPLSSSAPENRGFDRAPGGETETLSFQLPGGLSEVFRAGAGDELSDFASYALTRFLLREHWVELEDCPLLPFLLQMTNDVVDYQLAPDAATAVAQAEAAGEETVLQVELDLGLTVVELESEGIEDF